MRLGSPPRMRGKPYAINLCPDRARITPADAGKTRRRSKGEGVYRGSPPRMRGKRGGGSGGLSVCGITPADAGKTLYYRFSTRRSRDHPRGCGENLICFSSFFGTAGSPPRMRGKRNSRAAT